MGSWFKGGGAYFKIENGEQPIPLNIDRKSICLNICFYDTYKVKTKASILQQYLLCLIVYQNIATETIGNYVFSSLNIDGVRKCKY